MSILLTMAWRALWLHKLRTVLTIMGVMLGVAVILAVRTANRSTLRSIETLFDEAAGKSSLTVESAVSSRYAQIGFSDDTLRQAQTVAGVVQAVPRLTASTVFQGKKGPVELSVQGVDPNVDQEVRIYPLVDGSFLPTTGRQRAVLVVEDFAEREGIRVGRDIELLTPSGLETFRVAGILARKNAGVTSGGRVVFVSLRIAQEAFQRGRKIDALDVVVKPDIAQSPVALQQFKEQLQTALGDDYIVLYPAAKGSNVAEALSSVQYSLELFGLFALFASALLIHTTFTMAIAERMREVGMLRMLGTSHAQIVGQLLGGALLLGAIGVGLGLIMGFVMAVPLLGFFASLTGYGLGTLSPSPGDILLSGGLGLIVTLLSALWPVIRAGRLSPLEAVRVRGQTTEGRSIGRSWVVGLALLAIWGASFFIPQLPSAPMFIVFFGGATLLLPSVVYQASKRLRRPVATVYGYEGSLGATNLERSRWRTSTTVAVLMIGVAMGVSIGAVSDSLTTSIRSWVDSAMGADLFISSYSSMDPLWGRRLAAIDGVDVVSPLRILDARVEDPTRAGHYFTARVQAIDPATLKQIGEQSYVSGQGAPADLWAAFEQGGSLLVSTQYADRYDIRQGDQLRLRTARGMQEFPVTAVILDYNSMRGTLMISQDDLRRYFGLNDADVYLLKIATGADVEAVRQRIDAQYGRSGQLTIQSNSEVRRSLLQSVGSIMLAFNAIVVIAFIIAAFGIANTLTMNAIERTREIGMLRAVGMTRFQVGKMVLAEALVMGVIGGVFGLAFGGLFSRVVVWWMSSGIGFRVDYVWPVLAVLISGALVLLVSQLAAFLPARRASGYAIVEALRYE